MTIESSFIPFPSEAVIPPAAYAAYEGNLDIFLVAVCATIGSVLGALVNYYLAKYLGRPIVYRFADSKLGHLCLLSRDKVHKAELYFVRKGAASTLIGRLIPGIRQLISIPAGLANMPIMPFIAYTALGSGIWNAILCAMGYYLASQVPREQLVSVAGKYSTEIGIATVIALAVFLAVRFLIKRARVKQKQ